jgi:hypothetical protein
LSGIESLPEVLIGVFILLLAWPATWRPHHTNSLDVVVSARLPKIKLSVLLFEEVLSIRSVSRFLLT